MNKQLIEQVKQGTNCIEYTEFFDVTKDSFTRFKDVFNACFGEYIGLWEYCEMWHSDRYFFRSIINKGTWDSGQDCPESLTPIPLEDFFTSSPKEEQKKLLTEIMQADEEGGMYENKGVDASDKEVLITIELPMLNNTHKELLNFLEKQGIKYTSAPAPNSIKEEVECMGRAKRIQ
jgi:hypothetical protein